MTLVYGAVALLKCHNKATEINIVLLIPNLYIFTRDRLQTICKMGVGWCKINLNKNAKGVLGSPIRPQNISKPLPFSFSFLFFFFVQIIMRLWMLNVPQIENNVKKQKVFLKAPSSTNVCELSALFLNIAGCSHLEGQTGWFDSSFLSGILSIKKQRTWMSQN